MNGAFISKWLAHMPLARLPVVMNSSPSSISISRWMAEPPRLKPHMTRGTTTAMAPNPM